MPRSTLPQTTSSVASSRPPPATRVRVPPPTNLRGLSDTAPVVRSSRPLPRRSRFRGPRPGGRSSRLFEGFGSKSAPTAWFVAVKPGWRRGRQPFTRRDSGATAFDVAGADRHRHVSIQDDTGHVKTTTVTYLKEHLRALLRRVQRGETVLILNRGEPVGRLEPVRPVEGEADAERVARLEKAGVLRPPAEPAGWGPILKPSPIRANKGQSVLSALLDDRNEGRRGSGTPRRS